MPINFTEEAIQAAQNGINRIQESLLDIKSNEKEDIKTTDEYLNEFSLGMSDDFNSSKALSVLFKLSESINKETEQNKKTLMQKKLLLMYTTLGFSLQNESSTHFKASRILTDILNNLLVWRGECKLKKDFSSSDKIREIITKSNIEIKDLPNNTSKWQIK